MSGRPRVAVLAERSTTSYLLINRLASEFDVGCVFFESGHRTAMLRHRLRRLGVLPVLGQLAVRAWDGLVVQRRSRPEVARLLRDHDVSAPDPRVRTVDVESVNAEAVRAEIAAGSYEVVVVSGTGILRRPLLESGPAFVNIHSGLTPLYRGVHGGFWAVHEGRPHEAGTTIHVVDVGVDTGGVLAQRTIDVDPRRDTLRTLPVKQYLAALDAMCDAVRDLASGRAATVEPVVAGTKQWYSPGIRDYLRFRRRMRALRSRGGRP